MIKRKPNGFVAKCQCGIYVGALDYTATDRKESGKIMGAWLNDGCIVEPRFEDTWSVKIEKCKCDRRTTLKKGIV